MDNLDVPKESSEDKIHAIVKGALGSIPIAGGIASEIFGIILSQPITERRERWMLAVVNELKNLERTIANFKVENLKYDPEFVTFLLEASSIAFKTHQEEKHNYLKNSIQRYFKVDLEFDKKHSYLRIIDDLTPTHLLILEFITLNERYIIENVKGFTELFEFYNMHSDFNDKYYFRKCVRDLNSISLIRISNDFGDFIGGGGFASDESAPSIKVLDFGLGFMEYLSDEQS